MGGHRYEIHEHFRSQYTEVYYQSAFRFETGSKAKIGYTNISDKILDEVIDTKFTGLTLNERLSDRRDYLIIKIRESISRGSAKKRVKRAQGKSPLS